MRQSAAWFFALRFIKGRSGGNAGFANRRYLLGAILGIALGFIPLVLSLVVANGMISGILDRAVELSSYHLQCVDNRTRPAAELREMMSLFGAIDGVSSITLERTGAGLVSRGGKRSAVTVRAVDREFLVSDTGTKRYLSVKAGTLDFKDLYSCILGESVAKQIQVSPGDKLTFMTVRTLSDGSIVPRAFSLTVNAIVSSGYRDLDATWCFIPFQLGEKVLTAEDSRQIIGIKANDGSMDASKALKSRLLELRIPGIRIFEWKETLRAQVKSLETTKTLILFIMGLIVIVASVNVSQAIVMLVLERKSDISLMRSLGASSGEISGIFVVAGLATGAAGTVLGLVMGTFVAINVNECIRFLDFLLSLGASLAQAAGSPLQTGSGAVDTSYYLDSIPIVLQPLELFFFSLGSMLVSLLSSLLPALRAGKTMPLETLRKA